MTEYPRAVAFLEALPKASIIAWLKDYDIGKKALGKLERRLKRHRRYNHE